MRTRADYRAALYMRLSKDDDGAAESASIITQRQLLRSYAAEHGYAVYDEYSDDGYSGISFERPEFRRMIADIEAKRVNLVQGSVPPGARLYHGGAVYGDIFPKQGRALHSRKRRL